jgi:hypothetical protein
MEVCNGLDDDCDGYTDDAPGTFESNSLLQLADPLCMSWAGAGRNTCQRGIGQCVVGIQTCVSGTWGPTTGEMGPSTEVCNDLDDDCDGYTDNAPGSRASNTLSQSCSDGCTSWNANPGAHPGDPGVCSPMAGQCKAGALLCTSGVWATSCAGATGPSVEICNGLDDDCDGATDDAIAPLPCSSLCDAWNNVPGTPTTYVSPPAGLTQSSVTLTRFSNVSAYGQSFVAPVTGVLTGFTINSAGTSSSAFSTATVELWNMTTSPWTLAWSSGPTVALGTTSLPSVSWSLPQPNWSLPAPSDPPPAVVAGNQYLIEFVVPTGSVIGSFTASLGMASGTQEAFYVAQGGGLVAQSLEISFSTTIAATSARSANVCMEGTGACSTGTRACVGGSEGACNGEVGPSNDLCNGLDDDCDGVIDDGYGDTVNGAPGAAMCPIANGMAVGQLGVNGASGLNQNCQTIMYGVNTGTAICGNPATAASAGCQLDQGTSTVKNGFGGACLANFYDFDSSGGTVAAGFCNGCEAYDLSNADIGSSILGNSGADTTAWCPASGGFLIAGATAPNGDTWGNNTRFATGTADVNSYADTGFPAGTLFGGNLTVYGTIMTGTYAGTYTTPGGASVSYYQGTQQYGGHNYLALQVAADNFYTGSSCGAPRVNGYCLGAGTTPQFYFGNLHISLTSPSSPPTNCGYPAPQYRMNVYSAACSSTTTFGSEEGNNCAATSPGGITSFDLVDNQSTFAPPAPGNRYTNGYRSRLNPYLSASGTIPVYIDIFRTDGYPDCDAVIGGANGADATETYGHPVNAWEYTLTVQKDSVSPFPPLTVSGMVTGVTGTGGMLQLNGSSTVPLSNGSFVFPASLFSGQSYFVTVAAQPTSQSCTVSSGSGTISANVTNVVVSCAGDTIGGTVSGLTGTAVLLLNGSNNLIASNGTFAFPASATPAVGASYAVTLQAQPSGQTCTVTNGSGNMGTTSITDVAVTCTASPYTYTLGGNVVGLAGTGASIQFNGSNTLALWTNGPFVFPVTMYQGEPYAVTMVTQPTGPSQTCVVTNATGTMGTANVTNVTVTCTTNKYAVKGTVFGLNTTIGLGLLANGTVADGIISTTSPTSFTFGPFLASGSSYNVTVATQPTSLWQTCSVTNGSGVMGAADVTNVQVNCVTNKYSVSAAVSGVTGTVVLQDNGGDNLTFTGSGTETFGTTIASGANYNVTVLSQPIDLNCTVESPSFSNPSLTPASGTIQGGPVTVTVNCVYMDAG